MSTDRLENFRRDAVRIALTSELPRKKIAKRLGIEQSCLDRWIDSHKREQKKAAEPVGDPNGSFDDFLKQLKALDLDGMNILRMGSHAYEKETSDEEKATKISSEFCMRF